MAFWGRAWLWAVPDGDAACTGATGDELGAHLDRLDCARRTGLKREPEREDEDAQDEQRLGAEHEDANASEQVRGGAHRRSSAPLTALAASLSLRERTAFTPMRLDGTAT